MILKLNFHFRVIGGNYEIVILCGALMSVCFLESLYVTMSEQCKKRSFDCHREFGFWTALPVQAKAAAVVTYILPNVSETFLQSIIKLININS
jgi:hypothetical protein